MLKHVVKQIYAYYMLKMLIFSIEQIKNLFEV